MRNQNDSGAFTSCTILVGIKRGVGTFNFPLTLKKDLLSTYICCTSIHSFENFGSTYYLVTDSSIYEDANHEPSCNILQAFESSKNLTPFYNRLVNTLSIVSDEITINAQTFRAGTLQTDKTYHGNLVVELFGYRSIKGEK